MARDQNREQGFPIRRSETGLSRGSYQDPGFGSSGFGSPFALMRRMQEDMDRLFGSFLGGGGWPQPMQQMPACDIHETENEVIVRADVPGVEPEDLEVYSTADSLILRGETRQDEERQNRGYHRSERRYGRFERILPLPAEVDRDKIQASFRNGVLEIRLPKTETGRQQMRRIPIQGGSTLTGTKGGEVASGAEESPATQPQRGYGAMPEQATGSPEATSTAEPEKKRSRRRQQ